MLQTEELPLLEAKEIPRFELIYRLFRMVKPVRGRMILAIIFGILNHLSNIALVTYGAYLIAHIFLTTETITAWKISIIFILGIIKAVSSYVEQTKNHDVAFRLLAHLRTSVYEKMSPLAPAKLIQKRSGDIVSTVGGDIELIEVFFAHTISPVVLAVVVEVTVLVFLGFIWYVLPLVLLVFHVFLVIGLPMIWDKKTKRIGVEFQNTLGETNAFLADSIQGLKTVLLFNQGQAQTKKILSKSRLINRIKKRHSKYEGILYGIINGTIILADGVIITLAIIGYQNKFIGIIGLILAIIVTISSFGPLLAVSSVSHHLSKTFAAANRLFRIIDETPAVIDSIDCVHTDSLQSFDLNFKNVNFKYDKNGPKILDDFTLEIKDGEHIALLGKSGTGKSTVLNLLLRYWDFESGEITIGGKDIKKICQDDLRKQIAIVSPNSFIFDTTIFENIIIGKPEATLDEVIKYAKMVKLYDFVMSLPDGFDTKIGEFSDKISGGERQKILLCRALIKDTPILLLDEPTSHLDSINESAIQLILNKVMIGKTVIIVTHKLSNLAILDRHYTIEHGTIT
jgi:ATP-binding cassette subfamily C protein